nr:hypothetical protein [Streptomyces sp. NRRL F-3307]
MPTIAIGEGAVAGHGPGVTVPQDRGDRRTHQFQHLALGVGRRQPGQPLGPRAVRGGDGRTARRRPHQ